MKKLLVSLATLIILGLPVIASADTITFKPTPVDLNDLDHHSVYTWRVDNVNLAGQKITGATLTIKNIRNWDSNPNMLFIHLLDTAKSAGVSSFTDDPTNSSPVTDIRDDFVDPRYHNNSNWLVANGTSDTFLDARSFTTTATNYTFTFTQAQLNIFSAYILNGANFALGFDPDCHFFNDGISLQFTTMPNNQVPEPATMTLLGTGLAGLYYARRRKQQQKQSGAA